MGHSKALTGQRPLRGDFDDVRSGEMARRVFPLLSDKPQTLAQIAKRAGISEKLRHRLEDALSMLCGELKARRTETGAFVAVDLSGYFDRNTH